METPHSMESSGFWEGREDESHLEETCSQAVSRNSSPLGSSSAIALLRGRVGPQSGIQLRSHGIVCRWPFQVMIGVGDMYTDQEVEINIYNI